MLDKKVSVEELNTMCELGLPSTILLVDVRTPEEYARGTIAGAKNIPLDVIAEHTELGVYERVYLFCLSGGRSQIAKATLEAKGFENIYNVEGGLLAWRAQKLLIQTPNVV